MGIHTEVYKDVIGPAAKEVGQVGGRSVKALLSSIRGLLWGWEKIEEFVTTSIEEKLKDFPKEYTA